jgi:hypothetical protein
MGKTEITALDVELDDDGKIVGISFKDQYLPWKEWTVGPSVAGELRKAYADEDEVGEELHIEKVVMRVQEPSGP